MSTLTVSNISNGSVSTSSTNVIQGSAKAWVNFNGTGTPAIRASYNVSSVTKNTTADYTITFTNALADANYTPIIGNATASTSGNWQVGIANGTNGGSYYQAPTTTTFRCIYSTSATSNPSQDQQFAYISFFR